MAGDWIKIRTDLYRDPKVLAIADHLEDPENKLSRYVSRVTGCDSNVTRNVMRNVTVGALVTVWGVTRHQATRDGDDAVIDHATCDTISDIADLPGFGEALVACGWMVICGESLRFPRFFAQHNTDPREDSKVKNRERQRRYRERKRYVTGDVTNTSQSNGRVEKSRVEKSREENNKGARAENGSLMEVRTGTCYDTPEIRELTQQWADLVHAETGKAFSAMKFSSQLKMRAERGRTPEQVAADLRHSIENSSRYSKLLDASVDINGKAVEGDGKPDTFRLTEDDVPSLRRKKA